MDGDAEKEWRSGLRYMRCKSLNYRETVRFHGHDGPFLALGYRLGRHIVKTLKPRGIMDLKITVNTRLSKPLTCVIDGLQCSTFATLGKGNLITKAANRQDMIIHVQRGNRKLSFRMSERAWDLCRNATYLEKSAFRVLHTPVNKLWVRIG